MIIPVIVEYIEEWYHLPERQALDAFYRSMTAEVLVDDETWLVPKAKKPDTSSISGGAGQSENASKKSDKGNPETRANDILL